MNPIKDWLNTGREYNLGVALYAAHGSDRGLLAMLEQGHSSYRQRRLEDVLLQLANTAQRDTVLADVPVHKPVLVDEVAMPESVVAEQQDKYRAEWLPLYMEMNGLRHQLIHAPDAATRGEWAHRILALERRCMAIWARRDYELRTGQPMPDDIAPAPIVTDRNALHRRLTNLRTYVTKENGKPAPNADKVCAWQEEITNILKTLDNG